MKKMMFVVSLGSMIGLLSACSESKARYVDLATGNAIELEKDAMTGLMVNKETGEPVYMYVDTKNKDTIYGKTGKVINGHIVVKADKTYKYDEDEKLEISNSGNVEYKDGNYKVEVEKDGDTKIKNGDKKVKIDGETGERKVKND
jgi:hypothetical protein